LDARRDHAAGQRGYRHGRVERNRDTSRCCRKLCLHGDLYKRQLHSVFEYHHRPSTYLPIGTYTLGVSFVPTDQTDYIISSPITVTGYTGTLASTTALGGVIPSGGNNGCYGAVTIRYSRPRVLHSEPLASLMFLDWSGNTGEALSRSARHFARHSGVRACHTSIRTA